MLLIKVEGSDEFASYDIDDIVRFGADLAIYDYHNYGYEGDGYILMKKGLVWYLHNCSHCSCFPPTDRIDEADEWKTIEKLKKDASEYLLKEITPILKLIPEEWLRSDSTRGIDIE